MEGLSSLLDLYLSMASWLFLHANSPLTSFLKKEEKTATCFSFPSLEYAALRRAVCHLQFCTFDCVWNYFKSPDKHVEHKKECLFFPFLWFYRPISSVLQSTFHCFLVSYALLAWAQGSSLSVTWVCLVQFQKQMWSPRLWSTDSANKIEGEHWAESRHGAGKGTTARAGRASVTKLLSRSREPRTRARFTFIITLRF